MMAEKAQLQALLSEKDKLLARHEAEKQELLARLDARIEDKKPDGNGDEGQGSKEAGAEPQPSSARPIPFEQLVAQDGKSWYGSE